MALDPGCRLGPYEIAALIGAGGMGEVYRARDTKLRREVAIKILSPGLALDSDHMARFEREAQVLASLNHPRIAALYGFEESGGSRALVMELVEGPMLSERIRAGALPVKEALEIARQIAEALEAAHERGIVHRDLKPDNVKLTGNDEQVKVLDFGLAKAVEGEPTSGAGSGSPSGSAATMTMHMKTVAGVILGTAAYMSPEQARGKAVDRRTDIWAFGVVLMEMLTGRHVFAGDTAGELLAAVIKDDPAFDALPGDTPASIRRLLARCLDKDPKRRLRDIGEARIAIDDAFVEEPKAGAVTQKHARPWVWIGVAALLAFAAPAAWFLKPAPEQPMLQLEISPPKGMTIGRSNSSLVEMAPDGRKLIFLAMDKEGKRTMWLRPLDASVATQLPGTDQAMSPFWSPDSRFVAFFANGSLKKVDTLGGPPQVICPVVRGLVNSGSWNRDGVILFAEGGKPLQRVDASGGVPSNVFELDKAREEKGEVAPYFLPDGHRFLHDSIAIQREAVLASLSGDVRRPLFAQSNSPVEYVPNPAGDGWLLYIVSGQLLARPFAPAKGVLKGDPIPVLDGLPGGPTWSASTNGVLAFRRASVDPNRFNWVARDGKPLGAIGVEGSIATPRISPDQKTIAFARIEDRTNHLWLYDNARETATRFTPEANRDEAPVWSPDGASVLYSSFRAPTQQRILVERPASGTGPGSEIKSVSTSVATGETRDGRWFLATEIGGRGIVLLSRPDGARVVTLLEGNNEHEASISPDWRWLMYTATVGGRADVFVQPLPKEAGGLGKTAGKWQVSIAGGDFGVWRRDGREIFYVAPDGKMMAVPVESGDEVFRPGRAKALFDAGLLVSGNYREYDVSADGQRLLLNQPVGDTGEVPITVIVNWPKLLQK